jgi:hypothetical protein
MTGRRHIVEGHIGSWCVVDLAQPDKTRSRHTTRQAAQAEADRKGWLMETAETTTSEVELWRARCLLALSLLNQRATPDGLSWEDTATLLGALSGMWDRPGEAPA